MEENRNLHAALFCFSFNVMLSYDESISLLQERIQSGFIDRELLKIEFEKILGDKSIDWTSYVIEHELITKYQADVFGNDKCQEYVKSLLGEFLNSENKNEEELC